MLISHVPNSLRHFTLRFARASALGMLMATGLDGLGTLSAQTPAPAADHPGALIYNKMCRDCHGKNGEGVMDKYDEPLHGNRSVEALTKRIARTMPDDNVGACVGDDAKNVAQYIYDAFYSPAAQARLKPPEIDLARLTIEQYRASVMDLIGRFRPGSDQKINATRGLKGKYNGLAYEFFGPPASGEIPTAETKKKERERVRFDRPDSQVVFNFGKDSPQPEKMADQEFSARWEGSVVAEETGTYEFGFKSENGVRVYINDLKNPLIDSWVGDGTLREEKKSIYLVGGRAYPLTVEFFKFKEKTASIALQWKTPHGVLENIPQRNLSPQSLRQAMIVSTSFPADDRSVGYERGTAVSKEWDAATTEAAIAVAEHVDTYLDELAGTKNNAPDRVEKLKAFCQKFAEIAFRRPLTDETKALIEKQFTTAKAPDVAVKRVVLFTLKSPRFLYPEFREADRPVDDFDVAARLALALWNSLPDKGLFEMAQRGQLHTRGSIASQASRMLTDDRTRAKLAGFFDHWLDLEHAENAGKDPKVFPEFDATVRADLRTSLEMFVDQIVWSEKSDYRDLLSADYLLLNPVLAKLYGKADALPAGTAAGDFQRVAYDPKERSGIVTHPFLLASFAYSKSTSPIHRGVFLSRNIVGMTLNPPPMAVAFEDAKFDPTLTMREKITELTKNKNCIGCHSTINPLGFTLENYDAIGRWRTKDNNKPIDPVSEFSTDEGTVIHLTGPRDIVKYAVENPAAHRAFIHQLFHHTVKQAVGAYGPDTLEDLRLSFAKNNFNIQKLLVEMAVTASEEGLPDPTVKKTTQTTPASSSSSSALSSSTPSPALLVSQQPQPQPSKSTP